MPCVFVFAQMVVFCMLNIGIKKVLDGLISVFPWHNLETITFNKNVENAEMIRALVTDKLKPFPQPPGQPLVDQFSWTDAPTTTHPMYDRSALLAQVVPLSALTYLVKMLHSNAIHVKGVGNPLPASLMVDVPILQLVQASLSSHRPGGGVALLNSGLAGAYRQWVKVAVVQVAKAML